MNAVTAAMGLQPASAWQNWGRNQAIVPREVAVPLDTAGVAALAAYAAGAGRRIRAVGSGHSFTAAAVAEDIQLRLDRLDRIHSVNRETGLVRVGAGIPLHRLNTELAARGLSMVNLGDIDAQTLAGALSTGTHGTGAGLGGLATQVRALQVVLADGSVAECSVADDPDLYAAARVGVGAFGVITEVTLQCAPLFRLTAVEQPMPLEQVLEEFDELADGNDHFEFYWFPHTDIALTKRNNRAADGEGSPLPAWREWLDEEFLSNTVFEGVQRLTTRVPAAIPAMNRLAARALSARTFTDVSHRVFVSPRRVRFREMEYAVPREHTVDLLRGVRDWVGRHDVRISFPIEVRVAAADDIWLSTATGRPSGYVAVHAYHRVGFEPYFRAVESLAGELSGRPHWGKLHWLGLDQLRERYPQFDRAMAVRGRVDPQRVFANAYTDQIFGP